MGFIKVEPDVYIAVQDINPGSDRTVVFIHGWPLMHTTFEYQYDVLPKSGYRCVGIDLRGFGDSEKPWHGYGYDTLSDDIRDVLDAMDLKDITLAGHSMGGAIAIRYMARHKGYRVANLALLAAAAPSFTQRPGFPYGMTKERVNGFINGLYNDRPQVLADFGNLFFGRPVTPGFKNWFTSTALPAAGFSTIKTLESLRDEDLSGDLEAIEVPTGIFQGRLDQICPYPLAVALHRGIRGSTLYTFEKSGHAVYYDELTLFNTTFLKFLNTYSGGSNILV